MKPTMFFYQKSILVQVFLYFAIFTFHCTRPSIKILKVRRVGVKKKAIFRQEDVQMDPTIFFNEKYTRIHISFIFGNVYFLFQIIVLSYVPIYLDFPKKNFFLFYRGDLKYRFVFEAKANVNVNVNVNF